MLQNHLFEDHRATAIEDYFVLVPEDSQTNCRGLFAISAANKKAGRLFICVVCWAKVNTEEEKSAHRYIQRKLAGGSRAKFPTLVQEVMRSCSISYSTEWIGHKKR